MSLGADGMYPHNARVWSYVDSAQVNMGRQRTNSFRKPKSWARLRSEARDWYVLTRAVGSARMWERYQEEALCTL